MTIRSDIVSEGAVAFMRAFSAPAESEAAARLRAATAGHPRANMQVSLEQGRLMALLARMIGARRALEVGVFTGYSALCIAEQLPPDGRLVACDLTDADIAVGRPCWEAAGVAGRIDVRLGPASGTLAAMIAAREEPFDFVFIDADKAGYGDYYEKCLALTRPGGLIVLDNVLLKGTVYDEAAASRRTTAMRDLLARLATDQRVDRAIAPVGDGIVLALKR